MHSLCTVVRKCKCKCQDACIALCYMKLYLVLLRHGPCLVDHTELPATHTFYTHKGRVIYIRNLQQLSPTILLIAIHFTDPRKDDSLSQAFISTLKWGGIMWGLILVSSVTIIEANTIIARKYSCLLQSKVLLRFTYVTWANVYGLMFYIATQILSYDQFFLKRDIIIVI